MDNFIVSARKYRPQTFETVVGQSHITTTLKNAIINGQLAHAFLFTGPRGVGKPPAQEFLLRQSIVNQFLQMVKHVTSAHLVFHLTMELHSMFMNLMQPAITL